MSGLRNFAVGVGLWGSAIGTHSVLSALETASSIPEKRVATGVEFSAENAEGKDSEEMVSEGSAEAAPFSGAELQQEVRAALKRWKKVPDTQAEAAASEFLALYRAVEADSKLLEKARNGLKRTLKNRLEALSRQILTHLMKERETHAKRSAPANRPENAERPRSVKRSGTGNAAGRDERDGEIAEMGQIGGGAGGFGNGLGGIGNTGGDGASLRVQESGEHLVEVIQATIHPDSWESNGGQGTIYFWMPNGSLIIRQTDANHEEIRNLLNQLRRAGS